MTTIEINENQVHHVARLLTDQARVLIDFADTLRPEQEAVSTENVLPTEVNDGYRQKLVACQKTAQAMLRGLARNVEACAWILLRQLDLMGYVVETEIVRDLKTVHNDLDAIDAANAIAPSGPVFGSGAGGADRAVV